MKKRDRIIYGIATGLFSLFMMMSAGMYLFYHQTVSESFIKLGFPIYLIYPLALAKILGIVAIITRLSPFLKEWAYAGFFFNILLAFSAHLNAGDGQFGPALVAMVLLITSYAFEKKVFS
ncbi:DoxX family protein [Marinilabiliaceae bacterium JC017]|nr:DoxX family protein [Marinilabiliaceae bacterium JC017]